MSWWIWIPAAWIGGGILTAWAWSRYYGDLKARGLYENGEK